MGALQAAREKLRLLIFVPIFFGMLAALQQWIFGELSSGKQLAPVNENESIKFECISCGFLAVIIDVCGGFILSLAICPSPMARLYSKPNTNRPPFKWWMLLGPVLLLIILTLVTIGFPFAKAVLTTILFNVGSVGTALVFDNYGFMSIPKRKVSMLQVLVVLLFLFSAIVASMSKFFGKKDDKVDQFRVQMLFPLIAGVVFAFFLSFNISSSLALPYMTQTSLLNYGIALPLALLIWGTIFLATGDEYKESPAWWAYTPGIMDMLMLMAGFFFMPKLGVTLYQQFFISGQLISSLIIDGVSGEMNKLTPAFQAMCYVGVCLTFIGAIISMFFTSDAEESDKDGDIEKVSDVASTAEPGCEPRMPAEKGISENER